MCEGKQSTQAFIQFIALLGKNNTDMYFKIS